MGTRARGGRGSGWALGRIDLREVMCRQADGHIGYVYGWVKVGGGVLFDGDIGAMADERHGMTFMSGR